MHTLKSRLRASVAVLGGLLLFFVPHAAQASWDQSNDEANRQRMMNDARASQAATDRRNSDQAQQRQNSLDQARRQNSGSSSSGSGSGSGGSTYSGGSGGGEARSSGPQSVVSTRYYTFYVRETLDQAIARITQEARDGNAQSQFDLGRFYYCGYGVKRDDVRARSLFDAAAKQGHAFASSQSAYMMRNGLGGTKDVPTAMATLKTLADKGDALSKAFYGLFGMTDTFEANPQADISPYMPYLTDAADAGEVLAQATLGTTVYYYGMTGAPVNDAKAVKYLKLAAAQNDLLSMTMLGRIKIFGWRGEAPDEQGGMKMMKAAAEAGYPEAMGFIGRLQLIGGYGLPKSEVAGVKLLKAAVAKGGREAMFTLGAAYLQGAYGVAKDNIEGLRLIKTSAELGDSDGMSLYAGILYDGILVTKDLAGAVRYARLAADAENADAQLMLGKLYYFGDGVPKDIKQATRWFQKAAANGNAEAIDILKEPDIAAAAKTL